VAEICREKGIRQNTLFIWKRKSSGVKTDDLKPLRELERENAQLRRIVAETALEIDTVKVMIRKMGCRSPKALGSAQTDGVGTFCETGCRLSWNSLF
jgi:putative transposase